MNTLFAYISTGIYVTVAFTTCLNLCTECHRVLSHLLLLYFYIIPNRKKLEKLLSVTQEPSTITILQKQTVRSIRCVDIVCGPIDSISFHPPALLAGLVANARFPWAVLSHHRDKLTSEGYLCARANQCHLLCSRGRKHC